RPAPELGALPALAGALEVMDGRAPGTRPRLGRAQVVVAEGASLPLLAVLAELDLHTGLLAFEVGVPAEPVLVHLEEVPRLLERHALRLERALDEAAH